MSNNRPMVVMDTDVVSYLLKGTAIASEYGSLLQGYQPTVSFVTAAELLFGAARGYWSAVTVPTALCRDTSPSRR